MSNNEAKSNMLAAIEAQAKQRLEELEEQATLNRQRLSSESKRKIQELGTQLEQELATTKEQLTMMAQSQLQGEIKQQRLENHHQVIQQVLQEAFNQLAQLAASPDYQERLKAWIFEGIQVVADAQVYVQLGKQDLAFWSTHLIDELAAKAKEELGMSLSLALHPAGVHAGIGPIVSSQNGRRICDNTLESRFARERAVMSRLAASKLF